MTKITTVAITALHAATLALLLAAVGLAPHLGHSGGRELQQPLYVRREPVSKPYKRLKSFKKNRNTSGKVWVPADPYLGFKPVTDPGRPDAESVRRGYRPTETAAMTPVQQDAMNRQTLPAAPILKGLKVGQHVVEAAIAQ